MNKAELLEAFEALKKQAVKAGSKALQNNYVIAYSLQIQSNDPTENNIIEWRKMTIGRTEFEKIGMAKRLYDVTLRLKNPEKKDLSKIGVDGLLELIEGSTEIVLLNNPNPRKQAKKQNEAE